jgi:FKBP-type peptidyl-prolyl cis-trans isomerase FkpA
MQIKSTVVLAIIASCFLAACGNSDYQKTSDGLLYKIVEDGKGDSTIKPGQYLKVYLSSSINDSIINSNYDRIPAYGMYDTTTKNTYSFIDFLGKMKAGDSAIFIQSIDTLQKKGMLQYNNTFKQGGTIVGTVKILKVLPSEDAVNADYKAEVEAEKQREIVDLRKYLKEKNIAATETKKGVFVVVENPGTGAQADSGMKVAVNYTGYLKNGKKFDSNLDSSFQHVQPLEFVVGTSAVIEGWDDGIKLFREGGKGKIYVPAMLAYGPQARGEAMPAFSDLIFEIDLLKVSVPTEAPPVPGLIPGQ